MRKIHKTEELICDACGCTCNCFDRKLHLCRINDVPVELCSPCVNKTQDWARFLNNYTDQEIRFTYLREYDGWKDSTIHE
jgi:hypothetical protein